jgi:hypothetical protein
VQPALFAKKKTEDGHWQRMRLRMPKMTRSLWFRRAALGTIAALGLGTVSLLPQAADARVCVGTPYAQECYGHHHHSYWRHHDWRWRYAHRYYYDRY